MAFFDQIKDMAKAAAVKSEEFAKTVGKKAEAAMDMQKLSSDIDKKEHYIKDNYMQMGMEIYEKAAAGEEIPEYLQEYCKLIDATQAEIDELQTKIDMIKQAEFGASPAKIPCPHCGAEILSTSKFCPECGGSLKQEKAAKENAEANDEAMTEETVVVEAAETEAEKAAPETAKEEVVEAVKEAEPVAENEAKDTDAEADTVLQAETVEENAPKAEEAKEAEPVIVAEAAEAEAGVPAADEITDAEIVDPAEEKADAEKKKEASANKVEL